MVKGGSFLIRNSNGVSADIQHSPPRLPARTFQLPHACPSLPWSTPLPLPSFRQATLDPNLNPKLPINTAMRRDTSRPLTSDILSTHPPSHTPLRTFTPSPILKHKCFPRMPTGYTSPATRHTRATVRPRPRAISQPTGTASQAGERLYRTRTWRVRRPYGRVC